MLTVRDIEIINELAAMYTNNTTQLTTEIKKMEETVKGKCPDLFMSEMELLKLEKEIKETIQKIEIKKTAVEKAKNDLAEIRISYKQIHQG